MLSQDVYQEQTIKENECREDQNNHLCDLVPQRHKKRAGELLSTLKGQPGFDVGSKGEVYLKGELLPGSQLRQILPIIFSGIRKGHLKGEEEFINFLQEHNLTQFIGSVSSKDWFYLGDM